MIERELGNWKDFIEVMLRKYFSGRNSYPVKDKKRRLNVSRLFCARLFRARFQREASAYQHKEQGHEVNRQDSG